MSVADGPVFPSVLLGNPDAEELLVFIAGFPDDCISGWGSTLETFAQSHRVVALCLPGLESANQSPKMQMQSSSGYTVPELLHGIHSTLERILADEPASRQRLQRPFVLVGHDWGSFLSLSYQNAHPDRVRRLVLLDVGMLHTPGLRQGLTLVLYQWWFAAAFLLSRIHPILGQLALGMFFLLVPNAWRPTRQRGPFHRDLKQVTPYMCYIYYQVWRSIFTLSPIKQRFPSCPLLFMYGKDKNIMFHSAQFISKVQEAERQNGSRMVSFEGGHWFMLTESERTVQEINSFVSIK